MTGMVKYDAVALSWAGDKFLGRPYSEMDCQAFVERCFREVGYYKDLAGSNAWWRECVRNGWTGTPEECVKRYGGAPKGALLFIVEDDGGEPAKYRGDGYGNASHMGIVTQRGDGAIHSSSTRGCVATSKFKDRTIRGGGWNRVGLLNVFNYGATVNWVDGHQDAGSDAGSGDGTGKTEKEAEAVIGVQEAVVMAENGKPVKMRQSCDEKARGYAVYDEIPCYTKVTVEGRGDNWCYIRVGNRSGWMMTKFLEFVADDGQLPAEDPAEFVDDDTGAPETGENETVTLTFTAEELAYCLPVLEKMTEQILQKVGRG